MTVAVLDLETTGLDPDRHHIWEIGLIIHDHQWNDRNGEYWWQMKPNLSTAEPRALQVNGYYRRDKVYRNHPSDAIILREAGKDLKVASSGTSRLEIARMLAKLLDGATVYTAVPHFDASFLERFMRSHHQCPTWNYRLRCVQSLAAGHCGWDPGGLVDCAIALDIDFDVDQLHSALYDARLADSIRRKIMPGPF